MSYSRIENGATVTPANDKLARPLVMMLSVVEALKGPDLMDRVANQTWTSVAGADQRIIAEVDVVHGWGTRRA